ncbi:DeoR family transcriptional regulator [Streptococcus constellatus subsp. pharyngis C1050]|nr:DeoR family transcriptional regulator [Streptococcus constellatus subsp. pharyngis C232]AGU74900.1 DeoR family transcriptional regulator [Streptococcus constellatus subsp. pharyngis C818]AGU80291.1 DeoR family transcriptional regulator [Streptococcus constellatus subsp. pharyngis C1050]AGU81962.1 DeoR family transcriptional regulator [Streptococcus anginosus C1051]AGU83877.1 DeoR family transcriptional regulator [Streptococcus anginosus C238]BAM23211.1 GlpR/DeoR family transcriptional repre
MLNIKDDSFFCTHDVHSFLAYFLLLYQTNERKTITNETIFYFIYSLNSVKIKNEVNKMERLDEIVKLVSEFEKIDVNTLSDKLKVSKVTIRKDLDKLEMKGLLHREHGYAVLNSGDDLNVRLSFHYDTKRKIAQEAAKIVADNETIIIESGSTCALLAEEICRTKKNVKIITNSYFIADYVRKVDSCKIILLGGEFQNDSQVTVGPLLKEMIQFFHVEHAFVGTDGYDEELGFTGKDLMRSEVVQYMSEASDKMIVLTDSSKFDKRGTVKRFGLKQVSQVVTDQAIPTAAVQRLKAANIKLTLV